MALKGKMMSFRSPNQIKCAMEQTSARSVWWVEILNPVYEKTILEEVIAMPSQTMNKE